MEINRLETIQCEYDVYIVALESVVKQFSVSTMYKQSSWELSVVKQLSMSTMYK